MAQRRPLLNPDECAALTRLALSYCLGRGSICLCSRTYSLQLHQPKRHQDYVTYQWRRLRQFLPDMKEPRYYPSAADGGKTGQWRLRVSSKSFETAYRLLCPDGFQLSSAVLELLGAEAIGSLWSDRGRVLMTANANFCNGRLNLSRYSFSEAELLHEWIQRLTGAGGRLHHGPRNVNAPMIYYDSAATELLISALRSTWMAQAPCLARKFRLPRRRSHQASSDMLERLAAEMMMPQTEMRRSGQSLLQPRGNRRIPSLQEEPRPEGPPLLRQTNQ